MMTPAPPIASAVQSARGGSRRRKTSSTISAASPAIAARAAVRKIGSSDITASRAAGKVPPNITMPTKPSSRPKFSRRWGMRGAERRFDDQEGGGRGRPHRCTLSAVFTSG